MKKVLKWIGIVLAALVGLAIVAVLAVYLMSNNRINAAYAIEVESLTIPTGDDAIERGEHVATVRGCADCHTENLAGGTLINDPMVGQIVAPNLTAGAGGIGGAYANEDWVRAIRHGVGPGSKPLIFMPSHEFYHLNDDDLGALIAYLKTIPAVDNQPAAISVGLLGRVLFLAGQIDLVPAEKIDHVNRPATVAEPGVTVEYGEYMAVGCTGCHGPGFSGGPIPGVPPDWPSAANLTPGGNLAKWGEQDFITTMRTGLTPEGKQLPAQYMPWSTFGKMNDDELKSIWLYLQSLPAKEAGNR